MVNLNNRLLLETGIASSMVLFGVVIKNTFEQLEMPNHSVGKPLGMGLFILGWVYIAYILSKHKPNKLLFILPSIGVLLSVLMMKSYMSKKTAPPMIFPIIFALSWITLGFGVGNHLTGYSKYVGLLASAMVLISMMKMLPLQRKNNVVDGPGMPVFVIAWVIIMLVNSNRQ